MRNDAACVGLTSVLRTPGLPKSPRLWKSSGRRLPCAVLLAVCLPATAAWLSARAEGADETPDRTVAATLHGLEIVLDPQSGSILRLSHPGPGTFLDAAPDAASILDLAYPVERFEPLRLASRFSRGAKIARSDGQLAIHWDQLGASRTFAQVPGEVSATVTLKAAPDGKSIIMTCRIANHSANPIRQVLFPDFLGLVPFGGEAATEFRSGGPGGAALKPFVALAKPATDQFYAVNSTFAEFRSSGKDPMMVGRWMLFGTEKAGFAFFPKRWVWDAEPVVMLQYQERTGRMRMMCSHYVDLRRGATWESCEYWLTPYTQGWSEANAPYRAWVAEQEKRK